MLNINEFFKKFKKISLDRENNKNLVKDVLLSFSIPVEDIIIKNSVIKVKASSVAKNQIFIKKKKILEQLKSFTDITY